MKAFEFNDADSAARILIKMTTRHDLLQCLKKNILEILPSVEPDKISGAGRLVDLGANSIDRAEIAIKTMEDLRVKIPLIEFAQVQNIGGLLDLFAKYTDAK